MLYNLIVLKSQTYQTKLIDFIRSSSDSDKTTVVFNLANINTFQLILTSFNSDLTEFQFFVSKP